MLKDRVSYYSQLEKMTNSVVLVYFTGDRQGFETQMGQDVYDLFVDQLEKMGKVNKLSLFLYSRGGDTNVAWSLSNLLRSYCKELDVIIPNRAHSAATLLSLGADKIYMTKQATLSPIDPSVNTKLNPTDPKTNEKASVSVESIKGFIQLAKEELGIIGSEESAEVLKILAKEIHPLVLGDVFRARSHIRMLARKLLEIHFKANTEIIDMITNFLCSDSWNHNYTIDRREAKESLGLNIIKPDDDMYSLIKSIYDDISNELQLRVIFNPAELLGKEEQVLYTLKRAVLETKTFGQYSFVTKGRIAKVAIEKDKRIQIQDNRFFENWVRSE